jgi:hypothetical protein
LLLKPLFPLTSWWLRVAQEVVVVLVAVVEQVVIVNLPDSL